MNHNIVVVYKSKTGFTKQYAKWISEDLKADLYSFEKRDEIAFDKYDHVIFGSSLRAGQIVSVKWLKSLALKYPSKKVTVFVTGSSSPQRSENTEALSKNFTAEEQSKIKLFYFQSGLCYEKLGTVSRLMMKMLCSMIKKSEGESENYITLSKSHDFSSKEYIQPLTEYANSVL